MFRRKRKPAYMLLSTLLMAGAGCDFNIIDSSGNGADAEAMIAEEGDGTIHGLTDCGDIFSTTDGGEDRSAVISSTDVGSVNLEGFAGCNSEGTYIVRGAGSDIENTLDAFHFVYGQLNGDGEVTARIDGVTETDAWTKVGVMLRGDLDSDAQNAFMLLRPSAGSAFQHRSRKGGDTQSTWQGAPERSDDWVNPAPYRARYLTPSKWIKMVRQGDTVTAYSSDDGLCWNIRWEEELRFSSSEVYGGIALTSHNVNALATAAVSALKIRDTAPNDVNGQCARAQVDGELARPTEWVVKPAAAGPDTWSVSTINPNPEQRAESCVAGGDPQRIRESDDDPDCPAEQLTADWAQSSYAFDSGKWQHERTGGFGAAGENVNTVLNEPRLWLRKEFGLSASDIDEVVFWGKWSDSASIYVNGVLATNTYASDLSSHYHYLGMNDRARAALTEGMNVIAVRVDCVDCDRVHIDFGIGLNAPLASYPHRVSATGPDSVHQELAQVFIDYTKEMAALGGTFAIQVGDQVVESHSLGWRDVALTEPMPANPVMRLASVDKRVTEAVIVMLYRDNLLHPDDKVFEDVLNVQPLPEKGWGRNVKDITVDQLRLHTSGVAAIGGGQAWQDEVAFVFGVSAEDLNKHHWARLLASEDTDFTPGSQEIYSNNGYFLLRYVAEHIAGKPLGHYLSEHMKAEDIVVAHERLAGRHEDEPGYMMVGQETQARWFALEEYLALSSSARGLAHFFRDYAPEYERAGDRFIEVEGGQGGAMAGTRSLAEADVDQQEALVQIWNSDLAGSNRINDRKRLLEQAGQSANP